ncbi:MAG: aa3-type cytochrome c oxidase subunit IV [Boseongicola sp. SB0676_bin_33]|nr:aa3-type cytochrome c oxidase subunit IV [Boseongicola sp. SB0676_bin_33]MYK30313.1 aa3-type cytochrome c oxidase subunit IV [Boseongicola sp. SB0670_bin_30]
MADHKHGEMEISDQEAVFSGFVTWVKNVTIVCFLVLIFLAVFNS